MPISLIVGKKYTFNSIAPAILGSTFRNAELMSIMNYASVLKEENVNIKFNQILPHLPLNSNPDPAAYIYYRFLSESGEMFTMMDQWINTDTVNLIEGITLLVTVPNASYADIDKLTRLMNSAGYVGFTVKQQVYS